MVLVRSVVSFLKWLFYIKQLIRSAYTVCAVRVVLFGKIDRLFVDNTFVYGQ